MRGRGHGLERSPGRRGSHHVHRRHAIRPTRAPPRPARPLRRRAGRHPPRDWLPTETSRSAASSHSAPPTRTPHGRTTASTPLNPSSWAPTAASWPPSRSRTTSSSPARAPRDPAASSPGCSTMDLSPPASRSSSSGRGPTPRPLGGSSARIDTIGASWASPARPCTSRWVHRRGEDADQHCGADGPPSSQRNMGDGEPDRPTRNGGLRKHLVASGSAGLGSSGDGRPGTPIIFCGADSSRRTTDGSRRC